MVFYQKLKKVKHSTFSIYNYSQRVSIVTHKLLTKIAPYKTILCNILHFKKKKKKKMQPILYIIIFLGLIYNIEIFVRDIKKIKKNKKCIFVVGVSEQK